MKKIDSRFPVFLQLEEGDGIYFIDLCDAQKAIEYNIISDISDGIIRCENPNRGSFNYVRNDAQLRGYWMSDRGYGWATNYDAAKEAVKEFAKRRLNDIQADMDDYTKKIEALNKAKVDLTQLYNQFTV